MKGLGNALRQFRQERGMSMRGLADAAGLSVTYISKIEGGGSDNITIGALTQLADALNLPVTVLFDASVGIAPTMPLPTYLYDAADILTWDDWAALRSTVEHMAALRRLSPSPEPS